MYITKSLYAYRQFQFAFSKDVEEFWGLALSANKKSIATRCLFRGTVDKCMVHPRDIFRFSLLNNASSLLLAHNHPSGDLHPSESDIEFTQKITKASHLMEIPIVDHLILGENDYWSFADNGWDFGTDSNEDLKTRIQEYS